MRSPVNGIDEAYFCAKAEQASRDATGGTVIPTAHLEATLDMLDCRVTEVQTILEAALRAQFRKTAHRALQNGEHAIPLSTVEIQALAALVGQSAILPLSDQNTNNDNVIPFPALPELPADIQSEPA